MHGKMERPAFHVEERHLDGGLRLEALRALAIHEGQRAMEVEGIAADEGGGESRDGVVDVDRGHEGVARGRVDIAPSLDAFVRGDLHEHAALHGGCAVYAANRADERDVDEDRRDGGDAHGVASIPPRAPSPCPLPRWGRGIWLDGAMLRG